MLTFCRFSLSFFDVSQTLYNVMCPANNISSINGDPWPLLYIYAFTGSEEPLWYSVMIEHVRDFVLE
jgi:hypothetical protein